MKQILIVDDDEMVLSGLAATLEAEGFGVRTATSGSEGLDRMGAAPADLVLTDLVMENMDGLTLMRHIAERWPEAPVIVLTGHGTASSAMEAVRQGAADFIQKPARPEEIVARIQSVFATQDMRHRLQKARDSAIQIQKFIDERASRRNRMDSLQLLADGVADDLERMVSDLERDQNKVPESLPDRPAGRETMKSCPEMFRRLREFIALLRAPAPAEDPAPQIDLNDHVRTFLESPAFHRLHEETPMAHFESRLEENLPPIRLPVPALKFLLPLMIGSAFEGAAKNGRRTAISTGVVQRDESFGRYFEGEYGRYVYLRVQHNGHVKREDLERMFEPFYAIRKMGRTKAGPFGFTRLYQTVHRAGGFIEVRSEERLGAELSLYFPVPSEIAAPTPAREAGTMLVVDDLDPHRQKMEELLKNMGYQVEGASSVALAVEACVRRRERGMRAFDLALIDLMLGEAEDGVDLYRRLKEIQPELRAILVGGFADLERISEARADGIHAYLQKPLSPDTLGKAVRAALSSRG